MNFIDTITFGAFETGSNVGRLGITVTFNGKDGDIIELVSRICGFKTQHKNVRLKGPYPNDVDMKTLVKFLFDRGYTIEAHIDGRVYHSWLVLCHWIVAHLDSLPWANFNVHEIRFYLKETSDNEPFVPTKDIEDKPVVLPQLFLVPPKDLQPEDLFSFFETATYRWRVLLESAKRYEKILYRREK